MNDLWEVLLPEEAGEERLRSHCVSVPLKEAAPDEAVFVYSPPSPLPDAVNARTPFVQRPPGTPSGFPVPQFFREEGTELHRPFAEDFMTPLKAAVVKHFLDASITEREAVVEPDRVLNDGHRGTVTVRFQVSHGGSASSNPIQATQPPRHHV